MDEQWFSERVKAARDKLFRIAYSILHNEQDCADALQDALLKAWMNLDRLRQPQYFDTWLVRILINECRRVRRRTPVSAFAPEPPPEDIPLHDALRALEEKYRLPLILHYMEGYSLEEIAYLLRVPMGTVKSRMHAGRKSLRQLLEEE